MIKVFDTGILDTNTYVVWNEDSHLGMIIDCGVEPRAVLDFVNGEGISVKYIVLTHGHFDHAEYVEDYEKAFEGASVVCHENELCVLNDADANLSYWGARPRAYKCSYTTVKEGDVLSLGEKSGGECMNFEVLHTPGHTPGGICLYCQNDKIMFTGDTLFKRSYGRTDFKYGDARELFASLRRLYHMDGDTTFYPGHYQHSTIKEERGN